MSRSALLVTHTGRRQSTQHAQAVARDLVAAGFEVRVIAEEVDDLELPPGVTPVDDPAAAEGAEIVLALGGDGTFLRAAEQGLGVAGVAASPLPGPSGNVEFFVWFRRDAPPVDPDRVRAVVAAGPSGEVASAGPAPTPDSPPLEEV